MPTVDDVNGDNACGRDYSHAPHDEESPFRPGHINVLAERTHSPVSVRAPTRRRMPVLVPSVTPCPDDCYRVSVCCRQDLRSAEWADFVSKKWAVPTNRGRQRQPVISVGFCDAASRTSARRRWESLCSVGAVLTKRCLAPIRAVSCGWLSRGSDPTLDLESRIGLLPISTSSGRCVERWA